MGRKFLLSIGIVYALTGSLFPAANVLYFNNIARPMGMGGAFTAVEDSLQNHLYNPGAVQFGTGITLRGNVSFDLIRGIYLYSMMLDAADDNDPATDEQDAGYALLALIFSTANLSFTSESFFFKFNFLDQLITRGADFPMYSSSITMAYKFKGIFNGFRTGVTGHVYNLGSDSLPQGYSASWGLFYRSHANAPFSLGMFYFHASDDMPWIRRPFEQIMNNTVNVGAAYAFPDRFTLSFDLRNINNFSLNAYCQPHIGLEKVFLFGDRDDYHLYAALRTGAYYDSDTDQFGYSFGGDIRFYFPKNTFPGKLFSPFRNPGYFYLAYTLTREKNVPSYNNVLQENHIISLGAVF